jgi:hypothetical protein
MTGCIDLGKSIYQWQHIDWFLRSSKFLMMEMTNPTFGDWQQHSERMFCRIGTLS